MPKVYARVLREDDKCVPKILFGFPRNCENNMSYVTETFMYICVVLRNESQQCFSKLAVFYASIS
jgi:hypothetical protein